MSAIALFQIWTIAIRSSRSLDPEEVLATEAHHVREYDLCADPELVHHRYLRRHIRAASEDSSSGHCRKTLPLTFSLLRLITLHCACRTEYLTLVNDPHRRMVGRSGRPSWATCARISSVVSPAHASTFGTRSSRCCGARDVHKSAFSSDAYPINDL